MPHPLVGLMFIVFGVAAAIGALTYLLSDRDQNITAGDRAFGVFFAVLILGFGTVAVGFGLAVMKGG